MEGVTVIKREPKFYDGVEIVKCNYDQQNDRAMFYQKMLCAMKENADLIQRQTIVNVGMM